jgi:hypothetical protein
MPEFSSTIHIDAPRSQVWETIADLGGIQRFLWLDSLVVRRQLERMVPSVLRGLMEYAENDVHM